MDKILLIETSADVCGAAVSVNGNIVAMQEEPSNNHSALLSGQIEHCIQKSGIPLSELDAVAVSCGPGSYTSLRVGVSVAKGICYSLDKPFIAVDTMKALAFSSQKEGAGLNLKNNLTKIIYIPMIDARRMEVCMAVYSEDLELILPFENKILSNNMFYNEFLPESKIKNDVWLVLSGNGTDKAKKVLNFENMVFSNIDRCSVQHLVGLASTSLQSSDFQSLAYFEPTYMKPPNITSARNTYF